jgi:ribosome-associated heat shock protein Hsp15
LDRQRIDKWLWHARLVRTRTAAAALAGSGHVRVNGRRIELPSQAVREGDVITVALDRAVRVLKVLAFAERRGSADIARCLYEDLSAFPGRPLSPPETAPRERGEGRPTKRDRRAIDRFTGGD